MSIIPYVSSREIKFINRFMDSINGIKVRLRGCGSSRVAFLPSVKQRYSCNHSHKRCSIGSGPWRRDDGSLCDVTFTSDPAASPLLWPLLLSLLFWPFRNDVISIDDCCPLWI